jgi:hypothetical protein
VVWRANLPKATTKIQDAPDIFMDNWLEFEDWTGIQHKSIATASVSGKHVSGRSSVMMVAGSATIAAIASPPPCAIAFDTNFNVVKYYNGSNWINLGGTIEAGTTMAVWQNTAPIGWTLNAITDDKLIYITKGSAAGGEIGGAVHSTGSWTWSHTHTTNPCALNDPEYWPYHIHNMGLTWGAKGAWKNGYPGHMYSSSALCATVTVDLTGGAALGSADTHTHGNLGWDSPTTWRMASQTFILVRKD